ncbi:MAG: PAS domain S-box protein [Candidatus Glassbacteria bacterium]|nr:PAS domain S-box protein [Candidatus Glassbacteria bacterium]
MTRTIPQILEIYSVTALEHVNSGVLAVNLKGEVVMFNQAAEAITGYERAEILGNSYQGLPFYATGKSRDVIAGFLENGELQSGSNEKPLCRKDGSKVPVESRIKPVCDEDGKVVGALEIFTDLSTIKELKVEVNRSRTLSALGEMAANVAHEIRNPLGGIGGFAALLERDLDDDDPRRNLVKKIIEGVASLDKIVTNLLIYTRPIKPDLRWIDLTAYVDEVLSFVEVELESQHPRIDVRREFPGCQVGVRIDPSLMQQILLNIFRNAIYAMKNNGGCLIIKLSSSDNGGKLKDKNGKKKDYIELLISDNGVGMSREVREKIFNPFFTTREDGTGLGLAIAKKMIHEQQGSIDVSSRVGVGTKVSILLPHYP